MIAGKGPSLSSTHIQQSFINGGVIVVLQFEEGRKLYVGKSQLQLQLVQHTVSAEIHRKTSGKRKTKRFMFDLLKMTTKNSLIRSSMIHQPTDKVSPRVIMRTNQIFILQPFKCKNVLLSLYNFGFGVVGMTGN